LGERLLKPQEKKKKKKNNTDEKSNNDIVNWERGEKPKE